MILTLKCIQVACRVSRMSSKIVAMPCSVGYLSVSFARNYPSACKRPIERCDRNKYLRGTRWYYSNRKRYPFPSNL